MRIRHDAATIMTLFLPEGKIAIAGQLSESREESPVRFFIAVRSPYNGVGVE